MIKWLRSRYDLLVLITLAYIPLLLSAPGKIPADTKLYLYLDPGRLMSDSVWSWDTRQLGGWVPHQNVGYLWPSGPWFGTFDFLGVPDWIAHRLWLGTLLIIAGLGVRWLAKLLELPNTTIVVAAMAYQLSPYILPYISRTSALLLPWALLPWIVGLTISIIHRPQWKYLAIFGLLIMSSGGLNATALLMIAPAPLIWLADAWWSKKITLRRFGFLTTSLAATSVIMSAWWIAGLSIQNAYGAPVLSYSEALQSTSATTTATESLRGLGYWLFYDRNDITALTSASTPYQNNLLVIVAGIVLVVLGIFGLTLHRHYRRPLSAMLLVGVILSVGAYPYDSPSPLWSWFVDHPTHSLSLALRSSSRAVPLVVLALALGLALSIERLQMLARFRQRNFAALVRPTMAIMICVNMPALFGGRLIDPAISRPDTLPAAWNSAADFLDARFDDGYAGSVLVLPGIESAAYRWGYPVDPILPGLTKKAMISRDWLPLGSAPFMDLLYALDDSFQNGTASPDSIAPIAQLLGADTIMVVNSYQYERFGTPRPERYASLIASAAGLEPLAEFGSPQINYNSKIDSSDLEDYPPTALPEIVLYAVRDTPSGARVTQNPIIVSADGQGMVDLAAARMITGTSTVISSAALDRQALTQVLTTTPELIVTDSNRKRAHHWRSSQEVWGATEGAVALVDTFDAFDNRLPVFPLAIDRLDTRTISTTPDDISLSATAYGALLSYRPEYRPANANDNDLRTAWLVGWGIDPIGQVLTIRSNSYPIEKLQFIDPKNSVTNRQVSEISVSVDGSPWSSFRLAESKTLDLFRPGNLIRIRIDAIEGDNDFSPVGWAEILPIEKRQPEIIQMPTDATLLSTPNTPVSYLMTRQRADSYDSQRQDPELYIQRSFNVPHADTFTLEATATFSAPFVDDGKCRTDLLELDSIPLEVRVVEMFANEAKLVNCSKLAIDFGTHLLTSAIEHILMVDQISLRSNMARSSQPSVISAVDVGRTQRSTRITRCPNQCWVEFADGWNPGWQATLSDGLSEEVIASSGGRLLWKVSSDSPEISMSIDWAPQKRMWLGIIFTMIGLSMCLAILFTPFLRRRPFRHRSSGEQGKVLGTDTVSTPTSPAALAVTAVILTAAVVNPIFALVAGSIAVAIRRYPHWLRKIGGGLIALGMLFLLAQQIRTSAVPSFGWPSVFRRSHQPIMLGLVLLVVGCWDFRTDSDDKSSTTPASVS